MNGFHEEPDHVQILTLAILFHHSPHITTYPGGQGALWHKLHKVLANLDAVLHKVGVGLASQRSLIQDHPNDGRGGPQGPKAVQERPDERPEVLDDGRLPFLRGREPGAGKAPEPHLGLLKGFLIRPAGGQFDLDDGNGPLLRRDRVPVPAVQEHGDSATQINIGNMVVLRTDGHGTKPKIVASSKAKNNTKKGFVINYGIRCVAMAMMSSGPKSIKFQTSK